MFVTKFVWAWCLPLVSSSVIKINLPWLIKLLERIYDDWGPSGGSVFRQTRGMQRKPLPTCAVLQVPSALSNPYTKAAYFGVAYLELLLGEKS